MNDDATQTLIKGIIETQVIQALNSAPEAIEKLVKAALSKPVTDTGDFKGYRAARSATHKVIQEYAPRIEDEVRKGLSSESIVAALTKAIIGASDEDWRIKVSFAADKDSR